MRRVIPFVVLLLALLLYAMSLHASNQDAAGLAAAKCVACHDSRRICFRIGKQEAAFWQQTVARMRAAGAKIDESQAAAIAGWLASPPADAKPLCP
ncbi:hypothetical protein [Megalodesulfovibrio gigas]|uniref:hypothetical protein n=1 Tax=Megalodesulfovibrio gigas TaxID=879 RepID=UPI0003F76866|nr:hypothetical protein [Megalodesulfovibrio gigas]